MVEEMMGRCKNIEYFSDPYGRCFLGVHKVDPDLLPSKLQDYYNDAWVECQSPRCHLIKYKGEPGLSLKLIYDGKTIDELENRGNLKVIKDIAKGVLENWGHVIDTAIIQNLTDRVVGQEIQTEFIICSHADTLSKNLMRKIEEEINETDTEALGRALTGVSSKDKNNEQVKLLKFRYWVTLIEGFKPVMSDETETELSFVVEAKNRVTADRMVKAMIGDAPNVVEYDGVCIDC